MVENKHGTRLSKAAREFNVGISTIVDFLSKKGYEIEGKPNTKISQDVYDILIEEFQSEKVVKEESKKIGLDYSKHKTLSIEDQEPKKEEDIEEDDEQEELFIKSVSGDFGKSTITKKKEESKEEPEKEEKKEPAEEKKVTRKEPEKEEKPEEKKTEKKEPETKKTTKKEVAETKEDEDKEVRILGKIDLESMNMKTRPSKKTQKEKQKEIRSKKKAEKEIKPEQKKIEPSKERKTEKPKHKETKKPVKDTRKPKAKKPAEEKKEISTKPEQKKEGKKQEDFIPTKVERLSGPKILDKIDLPEKKKPEKKKYKKGKGKVEPVASSTDEKVTPRKKKRKRIIKPHKPETHKEDRQRGKTGFQKRKKRKWQKEAKPELSEEEIQKQIKETLSKLSPTGKSKAAKYRRQKRATISQAREKEEQKKKQEKTTLKVTEFVTVNELASMMDVPVNEIISTCMALGLFVSINQRLDAETLTIVAEEFGFKVEFVSVEVQEAIDEKEAEEETDKLEERPPIVTVMGHVDHGKTKLLDHIRKTNVVAGEAGGITQHIGAYEVVLEDDKRIVFLDTPGHEAFTAMRARGAKVTDVAIIVIAADDNVMPQTKEAINHAQAAGVPIVFAINKIDKPNANPDKIKEKLSQMNILVEDWGGKYQSQDISAKGGINIEKLLEKVLLEAELLELKGNLAKNAVGTVIESSLDKGRGYIAKVLVQNGTMKIGDMVLAGSYYGKVKAMYNERNQKINEAGPSTPVLLLGLNGAPQAGDGFNVMTDEREAKEIATKRLQLQREQGIRTQKHITLDEIGRRIAIGDFKELNVIVKADVDGSVEALSDSLLKLGTEEVQVNVIHKTVGAITETDVMLASASNAIIIGFQVRPSASARKLAETEQIDIRFYSVIYQAIEEIKAAIEGMLAPEIEEKIVCNVEVRNVFKITKVGTVAGCMVLDGKITRNTKIRIIRDGIVIYTGKLGSLKRFKDDVKEVQSGYECGLNVENYNDIKVGDIIEGYEEIEVKRKL